MFEWLEAIKNFLRNILNAEIFEKVLGIILKIKDVLVKVVDIIVQVKDWLFRSVMNLFR